MSANAFILVPEEHDGLEYGFTGIGIVLEETGRTLTPSPLLGFALIGVATLLRAGSDVQKATLLPRLASGSLLLSVAVDTAEAIQMHGGIGMTDEFDIGFFFKRARILEIFLGDRYYHLDRFALARGY